MIKIDCILHHNQIAPLKEAMKDVAELILQNKKGSGKNANVTVDEIYKEFKSNDVDVDIKSIASLYRDVFAHHIDANSLNFQTEAELEKYTNAVTNLSERVKSTLIDAGFFTESKSGNKVLDWYKIMSPLSILNSKAGGTNITSQKQAVRAVIEKYVAGEVNNDSNIVDKNAEINRRVDEINDQLKNEWAQIISNAISKKTIELNRSNGKPAVSSQSSAIKRLGKMVAIGLTESDNEYKEAMRKVLAISPKSQSVLSELDEIGRVAFELTNSEYGDNNELGVELERQANILISKARFAESNTIYKIASIFRGLVDMGNLAILNNPANRGENWVSSQKELAVMQKVYGETPKEIRELGKNIKKDISRRGGADFGGVTNQLFGDRQTQDIVREAIIKYIKSPFKQRAFNRMFNFVFGTTALNGNDSATKVQLTWIKFIAGLEDILISKNPTLTKKQVRDSLNEELFGTKWEDYKRKAELFMQSIDPDGKHLAINDQTISRFAADIAKAELISSRSIDLSLDEVDSAYRAAYTSAGRGIGHVPNNVTSRWLQNLKREQAEKINKLLKNKEYTKAGEALIVDAVVSRGVFRMIGGGMNWGVLKLQTGGLGIIGGAYGKVVDTDAFKRKKTLSQLTPREIQDTIEETQKINDRLARGSFGATVNTALLLVALGALKYGMGDDEEKKKWEQISKYLNEHRWANRYLNKFLPLYIATYLNHKLQQAQPEGYSQMPSPYKYNPALNQYKQLFLYRDETNIDKIVANLVNLSFKKPKSRDVALYGKEGAVERQKKEDIGRLSESISNLLNIDPLPYKSVVDMVDIYRSVVNKDGFDYAKDYDKNNSYWEAMVDGAVNFHNELYRKSVNDKSEDKSSPYDIEGIGNKTIEKLKTKNIDKEKLSKMTSSQIMGLKDEKGDKIFNTKRAYAIKNSLDGLGEGENKVSDMQLTDDEKKVLGELNINGVDSKSAGIVKSQINKLRLNADDKDIKAIYSNIVRELEKYE